MALKDLYLHVLCDKHVDPSVLGDGYHPEIVEAHNRLVEEVLKLRKKVNELERNQREVVKG